MEASSEVVSFLFVSILSGQSSCALSLDHTVGICIGSVVCSER